MAMGLSQRVPSDAEHAEQLRVRRFIAKFDLGLIATCADSDELVTIDIKPGARIYPLRPSGSVDLTRSCTVVDGAEQVPVIANTPSHRPITDTPSPLYVGINIVVKFDDGEEYAVPTVAIDHTSKEN